MAELGKDSRTYPRIFQQVDWSNGGDGIVIRRSHAANPQKPTVMDLKGKKIVLAQNSPSEYFVLNALVNGGVQPAEVQFIYTQDAFQAAAAFNADKSIAACVSWAPDIYNLTEVDANHLLVSTLTANKLIADVWFARADFARDHPDICEGLVRGIFDGIEKMKTEEGKKEAATLMASLYGIPADECFAMLGDAHSTNYAENREFFMNQNNPANFERTWNTAYLLYRKMGKVGNPVPFDKVMDFSIIQKLGDEEPYKSSKNEYLVRFAPQVGPDPQAPRASEILTKVVTIHFFPNSWDLDKKVTRKVDGKDVEELYDPNVGLRSGGGRQARQPVRSRQHHRGRPYRREHEGPREARQLVKELSSNRADGGEGSELVNKFNTLDPNQFTTDGVGWDRPANPADPNNHAKNRRVEIKVIALESPE